MDQFNLAENVDTLFHSLENFTQKEGLIGKAVSQGEKTFMPIVSVTVGYGGGNASMGKNATQPSGFGSASASNGTGALGLGAKLNTEAVIVIDNQNVSMLPMSGAGTGQIIDKLPQILSGITQKGQNQQPGQSSGQNTGAPYSPPTTSQ